ncbi:MAG: PAAR domain-containing protein [Fibrobacterales bacterium]
MAGKPAARLMDSTAHGGMISGPGCPTVMIGKMPAARLTDMHMCPMATPAPAPIPHVGGPISGPGSPTVLIGKMPAAVMGDMAVCVGPPSTIILGEMTVLIGPGAGGGGGGAAAAAASAAKAATKGPGGISAVEVKELAEPTELHIVDIEFLDAAGKPVNGVPYTMTDPAGEELIGTSNSEGTAHYEGYPDAGSVEIKVKDLCNAEIGADPVKQDEAVTITCEAPGFEDGPCKVQVMALVNNKDQHVLETIDASISGEAIEVSWTLTEDHIDMVVSQDDIEVSSLNCFMTAEHLIAVASAVKVTSTYETTLVDPEENPVADRNVKVHFATGAIVEATTDGDGNIMLEDVPPGRATVEVLPEEVE